MKGSVQIFKCKLILKSYHMFYVDFFILKTKKILKAFSIDIQKIVYLKQNVKKFTVLRSPHVDKKARDQFEQRTHKRIIYFFLKKKDILILHRVLSLLIASVPGVLVAFETE